MMTRKNSDEKIKNLVENNGEYILTKIERGIGKYYQTKVSYIHKKCNTETTLYLQNFKHRNNRCSFCDSKYNMTTDKFKNKFKSKREDSDEYNILGDYVKSSQPILVEHKICGNNYYVRPNDLINNKSRCPFCNNKIKLSKNDMIKNIMNKSDRYVDIVILDDENGKYTTKSYFSAKHIDCGNYVKIKYGNFIYCNNRCKCEIKNKIKYLNNVSPSKGHLIVKKYLEDNNIFYEAEKRFDWLKYKKQLRLDFYLPEYNIAIEYDGKQHYYTNKNNKIITPENLKIINERDTTKEKLLSDNGIELIRIPYTMTEEDIFSYLDLKIKGSTTR